MHDKESFAFLEERLRDEADRLLGDSPRQPPIADFRVLYLRSRQRRRKTRALIALAALVAAGLIGTIWRNGPVSPFEKVAANSAGVKTAGPAVKRELPRREPDVVRVQKGAARAEGSAVVAIGFLLSRPGKGGKPEFMMGWYFPERSEAIDKESMSPAERVAVSRLLGPESNLSEDETI